MTDTPGIPGLRLDVVELLYNFDPRRSLWPTHLVHLDGRPYTARENALVASATDEERELARTLTAAGTEEQNKRYDDADALLSTAKQASVPEHDARAFRVKADSPPLPSNLTVEELHQRAAQETAATTSAFREHILPHLTGWERGRAIDRLHRLDPAGTTDDDRADLSEFQRSKMADLKRLKEITSTYGPTSSTPLADYWDSIPETTRAELRDILHRLGWAVPGEETDTQTP